ncbi:protein Dok-7-like isoform X2 [Parambassis ranga]|uniref:Protein Dok-7-like isoform X2 n=1 Tax=Parambassis ranga TaxID=210632 RepID=A0A6P7JA39_9TELE|nr:protein Dok-7-like isoform X2 [Parambassis ranga]XP_028273649.1 protein Dok-7-like isoform X2 [Parambassis ranga]XP_028273658.1 protein Dok-7-like isoform X2 [Parambassis ranga]XP_028273667.1 protein Dok-7-like isoform X2 [Parambassis ranga]XP_028273674.1 protein Dok-7-like isoform X2 [Parambassis ranga]
MLCFHRFNVGVEPGTKLESGPASLHLCNNLLVLTRGLPPVVIGHWKLSALRRYGAVPNGFVFEGGTRCGYWAGVFFLSCSEGEQISFLFDCIVRGITPSRAPHGLRPSLPDTVDPSADAASAEERMNQETLELEKRLSLLSQCSLASSTASTYSCSMSVAGDDHSSVSSSSSSQSDASYGSRLPFWVEPLARPHLSNETASRSSTPKALTSSDDRLYAAVMGGSGSRPSSAQLHPRGLHDSGRQSSLDSGIGIATGSQSSYSGSYSSGSLDMASQGGGEEFGSATSLLPAPPSTLPLTAPHTSSASPLQPILIPEHSSSRASSSCSCASRSISRSSRRHSEEYQIPSLLRFRYDTPRSLLQALTLREPPAREAQPELGRDNRSSGDGGGGGQGQDLSKSPRGLTASQHQAMMQRSFSWGSEMAPSVDGEGRSTSRETQCSHGLDNYITPEWWRSARNRGLNQTASPGRSQSAAAQALCVREEHSDREDAASKLAGPRRLSFLPPSSPPPLPVTLSMLRSTSACGMFQSPHETPPSASLDTRPHRESTVNYVNIPIRLQPAKTRELLYTELDLQDTRSAAGRRPPSTVRDEGSSRYAHLDMAAMETAQRVGAEHVRGREDRLTQLESRRRGPPK